MPAEGADIADVNNSREPKFALKTEIGGDGRRDFVVDRHNLSILRDRRILRLCRSTTKSRLPSPPISVFSANLGSLLLLTSAMSAPSAGISNRRPTLMKFPIFHNSCRRT